MIPAYFPTLYFVALMVVAAGMGVRPGPPAKYPANSISYVLVAVLGRVVLRSRPYRTHGQQRPGQGASAAGPALLFVGSRLWPQI